MTNSVIDSWSAPIRASNPPTQKNGIAHRIRAESPDPVTARMALGHVDVCRTKVPWVCSTPLGSAVDPDVWIKTARSAGETSASIAASTSCGTLAAASSSQEVAHCLPESPVNTMDRRYGAPSSTSRPARWLDSPVNASSNRSATSMSSTRHGPTNSPMSANLNTFESSAAVYIVLTGTASAPIRDTANHQTTHSTPFGKNSPTRTPLPTPWLSNQRATCAERCSACS
jgi:hypothetical protein